MNYLVVNQFAVRCKYITSQILQNILNDSHFITNIRKQHLNHRLCSINCASYIHKLGPLATLIQMMIRMIQLPGAVELYFIIFRRNTSVDDDNLIYTL